MELELIFVITFLGKKSGRNRLRVNLISVATERRPYAVVKIQNFTNVRVEKENQCKQTAKKRKFIQILTKKYGYIVNNYLYSIV